MDSIHSIFTTVFAHVLNMITILKIRLKHDMNPCHYDTMVILIHTLESDTTLPQSDNCLPRHYGYNFSILSILGGLSPHPAYQFSIGILL